MDDIQRLVDIARLCCDSGRSIEARLSKVAEPLGGAMQNAQPRTCRIEVGEKVFWSPGYSQSSVHLERIIEAADEKFGRIAIGYPQTMSLAGVPQSEERLTEVAAIIIAQMLALSAGSERLQEQGRILQETRTQLAQSERLTKVGFWEYDVRTSTIAWADEAKRIADFETDGVAVPGRERLIAAFVREGIAETLRTASPFVREFPCVLENGSQRWLQAVGEIGGGREHPTVFGAIRDITEERKARSEEHRAVDHDLLTDLPNRRSLHARLDVALLKRAATGALVLFDLDRFNEVNSTRGHAFGDALLRAFAKRLRDRAGSHFVARCGSNEFALLLEGADRSRAHAIACALLSSARQPLEVFGRQTSTSISAGLAMFPEDGRDTTELVKNASLVLSAAKARGPNALLAFTRGISEAAASRYALFAEVRDALSANQFVPYYQPKISLQTGRLTGFEALARWDHPGGVRSPAAFLPALGDLEVARALFRRMLDRALADMAKWQAQKLPFGKVALNTATSEFYEFDLAGHVLSRLGDSGLDVSCLGLEITETVILGRNDPPIGSTLERLHDAGIEIALDDFGTGYASLMHLQSYDIDVVKIDRSFVARLPDDPGSQAIVAAVVGLGRSLGLSVVAEGIETDEQAKLLKAGACDQGQGYLFARPMPAEEVPGFIANWQTQSDEAARSAA